MLTRIMHDLTTQISRTPRPQRCRQKNKERAGSDRKPGKRDGVGAVGYKRRRNQVPQRRDGTDVIELRERKSHRINAADNPEPVFKFKLGRTHVEGWTLPEVEIAFQSQREHRQSSGVLANTDLIENLTA